MKNLKVTMTGVAAALLWIGTNALAGTPAIQTNMDEVRATGTQISTGGGSVKIDPGLYILGDDDHQVSGTHYLIVDSYTNNPDDILAVLVEQDEYDHGVRGHGRFFIGEPVDGGEKFMLSPVMIGPTGNLDISSDLSENAPVIEISKRYDTRNYRYRYLVQGRNGALGNVLMGMRASVIQHPDFEPWPTHNVFNGAYDGDSVVFQGKTVSVHNGRDLDSEYQIIPVNGNQGKVAELVPTHRNTMSRGMVQGTQVQKIAFFMKNCFQQEVFILASPTTNAGVYEFNFYGQRHRTFMDVFFPGRSSPY